MYMMGWWLIVGTVGEKLDARVSTLFYIILGVFAVALVGFLVVRGVSLVSIYTSS
jgi:bacteriorhodopsin